MSLVCKADVFNIGTAAAGNTVSVTGWSFEPKALLFAATGRTNVSDNGGNATSLRMFGLACKNGGVIQEAVVCSRDPDATAVPTANKHMGRSDACVAAQSATTDVSAGLATLTSMNSDGFTLTIDEQFGSNQRIIVLGFGGSDIIDVAVGSFQQGTVGTPPFDQDVTGLGFTGGDGTAVAFVMGARNTADNEGNADSDLYFGAFTSASQQACWGGGANDANASVTQVISHCMDVRCWASYGASVASPTQRAQFTTWIPDGFRWQWDEGGINSLRIYYLVIQGGRWALKPGTTDTTLDADVVITGAGVGTPVGGIVLSNMASETADNSQDADDRLSFGIFSGTTERYAQAMHQVDNVATSVVATRVEHDCCYASIDSTGAVLGAMDLQSFDADGVTFNMDDGDSSARFFWTVLAGSTAAAAGGSRMVDGIPLRSFITGQLAA